MAHRSTILSRSVTFCHLCFAVALTAFSLLLGGCGHTRKLVHANHAQMDTIAVSAHNNPSETFHAATPRIWELVNTELNLSFNFAKKEADGLALITVMPYASPIDTLVLDAKGMNIKSVHVMNTGNADYPPLAYVYKDDHLSIDVHALNFGSLLSRRSQLLRIAYVAKPYATTTGGSAAITEDRGLYFINTDMAIPGKPVQIWTQGETESNSHWFPTIDKPNQRSTFKISLTVPDTMQTLSNGILAFSVLASPGQRTDAWVMVEPIQVYAAMFAIGRFAIAKDEWKDARGMAHEVSYYTEPAYAPFARAMFRNTPEMLSCFSQATGVSFPWNKYSQVVVRDYVSGAMENTTASLFGEFTNKNARQLLDENNDDVVSHELFHQWFGDYVTAESWSNLTLNESFATYGEQIWRMYSRGKASADELAYTDLQRYLESAQYNDPALVRYYYHSREDMFDRVSYQKGASILRYAHSLAGDTLFRRAMEIYLKGHALNSAEAADWRLALEEATGKDWMPFFNEWYFRGGHPVLSIRYDADAGKKLMRVRVHQASGSENAKQYHLTFKTAVIYDTAHQRIDTWQLNSADTVITYPFDAAGNAPLVIPDVAHVLPAEIQENKSLELWRRQLALSNDYVSKLRAIDAAFKSDAQTLAPDIIKRALDDTFHNIKLYILRRLIGTNRASFKEVLTPQVKYIMQTDGRTLVRGAAFSVLGAWKDKTELPAMIAAVGDSSYVVSGSALGAVAAINPDTAYVLAKDVLRHAPKGFLQINAWSAIVSRGNPADMSRFEAAIPQVYGGEKMALANNLKEYAIAVKDNALYERSLVMLTAMAKGEAIRGYRLVIGSNVFDLRDAYKKKGDNTRRALAEKYAAQVIADEHDPENVGKYKLLGK